MADDIKKILDSVKSYIELEAASGVKEVDLKECCGRGRKLSVQQAASLEALRSMISGCTGCDLYKTRRNLVFGAGSPHAKLMFIGEAPGQEEDAKGIPFVGRAGQLLTKIIEAMGMKREDVYIANILKCRPPNNRAPLPAEITACRDNVRAQVELVKPRVICTLGKFASQTLLCTEIPISALRGNFSQYNGIKVMPTFHPAYLLRNPNEKKLVWDDMKKILKELNG